MTALERGSLRDWRRLIRVIDEDPWGEGARKVEQALKVSRPYGVAVLMERAIDRARMRAASNERSEIARQVREHLQRSELTEAEFAERSGTSASRLSTYLSGKVTRPPHCCRAASQPRQVTGSPRRTATGLVTAP